MMYRPERDPDGFKIECRNAMEEGKRLFKEAEERGEPLRTVEVPYVEQLLQRGAIREQQRWRCFKASLRRHPTHKLHYFNSWVRSRAKARFDGLKMRWVVTIVFSDEAYELAQLGLMDQRLAKEERGL